MREAASRKLRQVGRPAEALLEIAARDADLERRYRAERILSDFRYGLYPDTPADLALLARRFRDGSVQDRQEVVEALPRLGSRTDWLMLKLSTTVSDPRLKARLFDRLTMVDPLIADHQLDAAERLLERHDPAGFAACVLVRGTIAARIEQYRESLRRHPSRQTAQRLAWLCRAADDLPGARQAAIASGDLELQAGILHLMGRWQELAPIEDRLPLDPGWVQTRNLAYRAGCHRLAGNQAAFKRLIARIEKLPLPADDTHDTATAALLAHGKFDAALDRLIRGKHTSDAFALLMRQLRIEEAFALADRTRRKGTPRQRLLIELAVIEHLPVLGDEGGFRRRLSAGLHSRSAQALGLREHFIYLPHRMGRSEHAFRLCAEALSRKPSPADTQQLLTAAFKGKWPPGRMWDLLAEPDPRRRLALVRLSNDGKLPLKQLQAILDRAEQQLAGLGAEQRAEWLQAMGRAGYRGGALERAKRYFERVGAPDEVGDVLARMGRWRQAAGRYLMAYQQSTDRPAYPHYLSGWALTRAGRTRDGERLIAQAELLARNDVSKRQQIIWRFEDKQAPAIIARQRWLIGRTAPLRSWQSSDDLWERARTAERQRRFLEAADLFESAVLGYLGFGSGLSMGDYLEMAHYCHGLRARGHLAAGRIDAARAAASRAARLLPGDVELVEQVAPSLGMHGVSLFEKAWDRHAAVVRRFPNSAHHHHCLARLGAACRRRVAEATRHARRATELDPGDPDYRATLQGLLTGRR